MDGLEAKFSGVYGIALSVMRGKEKITPRTQRKGAKLSRKTQREGGRQSQPELLYSFVLRDEV